MQVLSDSRHIRCADSLFLSQSLPKRLKNARNAMFHKFQSQINVPFLADSRKKITRGACQAAKAVNMGVKIGLADSNNSFYTTNYLTTNYSNFTNCN